MPSETLAQFPLTGLDLALAGALGVAIVIISIMWRRP
jgi:hypothetical protein